MGTRCVFKGPITWGQDVYSKDQSYGDTIQYKDPPYGSCAKDQLIQWEYAVSTKDQSYEDMMHVQRTNPMGQCM